MISVGLGGTIRFVVSFASLVQYVMIQKQKEKKRTNLAGHHLL